MKLYSDQEILFLLEDILDIDTRLRGLTYLEKVSFNIYKYFNFEYIIIAKAIRPEHKKVQTIVALANGKIIPNFIYELQDDVVIGLLVFLDTKPIVYPEYYRSLIRILASRISIEIEHYQNEQIILSLQEKNLELSAKNQTDVLTGAYNRGFFFSHVDKLINEGRRGALLFIDLDDFKAINDTYGHQAGDHILQSFTTVVKGEIRKDDIFARYGGEEFVLFLPDANKEITLIIAQRIHESLKTIQSSTYNLTASIGVNIMEEKYKNLASIIKDADIALYKAKSLGKNRTVF